MKEFFENAWVCGIGGGIISGFIVYFITKWFMRKKDKSAYLRQINSANLEVISILKPYIADNGLPNEKIMTSIIASVARKYEVHMNDMYEIKVFCEELIKQIVENVYVSGDKKREYTNQLSLYMDNLTIDDNQNTHNHNDMIYYYNDTKSYGKMISFIGSFIAVISTTIMIAVTMETHFEIKYIEKKLLILLAVLLAPIITTIIHIIFDILESKRSNNIENELHNDDIKVDNNSDPQQK